MKPAGGVRREIRHNMPLYVGSLEGADRAEPLPRGWSLKVGRPQRGLSRQSEKCDVDDPLGRWSSAHQPRDLGQPRAADVTAASNDAGHMFLSVTAFRWARPISDAQSLTQPEGLVRIASRGPSSSWSRLDSRTSSFGSFRSLPPRRRLGGRFDHCLRCPGHELAVSPAITISSPIATPERIARLNLDKPARVNPRPGRRLDRRAPIEAALKRSLLVVRRRGIAEFEKKLIF
jgi:hypothetical protein